MHWYFPASFQGYRSAFDDVAMRRQIGPSLLGCPTLGEADSPLLGAASPVSGGAKGRRLNDRIADLAAIRGVKVLR